MKPLHEIAPWKVVSVTFGLIIFAALALIALRMMIQAQLKAGMGPFGLLLMGLAVGLAIATPALVVTAVEWLAKKRRRRTLTEPLAK